MCLLPSTYREPFGTTLVYLDIVSITALNLHIESIISKIF